MQTRRYIQISHDFAVVLMFGVIPKHGILLVVLYKWKINQQGVKILPEAGGGDGGAERLALSLVTASPRSHLGNPFGFGLVDLLSSMLNPLGEAGSFCFSSHIQLKSWLRKTSCPWL